MNIIHVHLLSVAKYDIVIIKNLPLKNDEIMKHFLQIKYFDYMIKDLHDIKTYLF